jgi:hypothetical protein
MDPLDPVVIVVLVPAMNADVPSANLVWDPDKPVLKVTAPVNVEPEMVATTELLIEVVMDDDELMMMVDLNPS